MGLSAICIHNFRKFSQLAIDLSGSVVIMGEDRTACRFDAALQDRRVQLEIPTETERIEEGTGTSCGSRWMPSSAGIATTGSRSTTSYAANRAWPW